MALSTAQVVMFEKARQRGAGDQGVELSDGAVRALVAMVDRDLGVNVSGDIELVHGSYFEHAVDDFTSAGPPARAAFERLVDNGPVDADLYFVSLAALHKARLKYQNILRLQPTPTLEQVGPRGLLQFGTLPASAVGALLLLRKWLFDIDNRAGQETGYLFEPILAGAMGGVPKSARTSPVKRDGNGSGRQVDCLIDDRAYEIKMRVTIAASGQGRWGEELAFPADCKASGYRPVLVVFDGTENPKLAELRKTFLEYDGEAHIGDGAWHHLESQAGLVMGQFIDKYVRVPLDSILSETPDELPPLSLELADERVRIGVGDDVLEVERLGPGDPSAEPAIPDDASESLPGF